MAMKLYEAQQWASSFLREHDAEEKVAEILLLHYLNISKTEYLVRMREELSLEVEQQFKQAIYQHVETGIPVQHITGKEEFFGREFNVNSHVLIPRPETEEVVLQALNHLSSDTLTCVDVGTGSGVIAVTLKSERPNVHVYATDISDKALQIAKKNADKHGAEIEWLQGNFLQPLIEQGIKVDCIISNPPYIAKDEAITLSKTVRDFDPHLALFADNDGLAAYEAIVKQAKEILNPQAMIVFEIGYQQGNVVRELIIEHFPNSKVEVFRDINGKDRTVFAWIE
ncbi:release factor glutamine methyltransferase [Gracilibacillus halotolerans]|uniref:Release factor glutamine methyltransferase n=1 Tax=Gracilibacillus halotolerans TaxID=74386 RepID=A0A841RP26_9BACI|nr:peptide chain release factor N(5)-glutamine methyltransferase [Gracilibacillus halotolerans]MBB6514269.1 release factor glutamine methyltransferase [Gracilibacillus halotolerans]